MPIRATRCGFATTANSSPSSHLCGHANNWISAGATWRSACFKSSRRAARPSAELAVVGEVGAGGGSDCFAFGAIRFGFAADRARHCRRKRSHHVGRHDSRYGANHRASWSRAGAGRCGCGQSCSRMSNISSARSRRGRGRSWWPICSARISTWGRSSNWPGSMTCWSSKIVRRRSSAANMPGIRIHCCAVQLRADQDSNRAGRGGRARARCGASLADERLQNAYPIQTRWAYLKRLAKYATFRLLCKPFNYGLLVRVARACWVSTTIECSATRPIRLRRAISLLQIRRQPSTPLLRMLRRRITRFDRRGAARLRRRTLRGDQLSQAIGVGMVVGDENPRTPTGSCRSASPTAKRCCALRAAGFDATARSSLIVVPPRRRAAG